MKGIVIYKSKYGATKQYADWLGDLLHIPSVFSDHFHKESLSDYDFIILGSSVYIGKLLIRDWLVQNLNRFQPIKVFLFIVGGTDPGEKDKTDKIVKDNLPGELKNHFEIYFLRGRLKRNTLTWSDRLLLKIGAFLTKDPKVLLNDNNAGKPEGIHFMIGRRPYAAFGNSTGDRQMLEYTKAGGGERLAMLVLHDDARREYAYGPAQGLPNTKVGTFTQTLYDEATSKGWIVISMKNDWRTIFADGILLSGR